eukprot:gene6202-4467_t
MLTPTAKQKKENTYFHYILTFGPLRSPGSPSGFAAAEMQKLCATGSLLTSLFIFLFAPFDPRPSPFHTTAHSL